MNRNRQGGRDRNGGGHGGGGNRFSRGGGGGYGGDGLLGEPPMGGADIYNEQLANQNQLNQLRVAQQLLAQQQALAAGAGIGAGVPGLGGLGGLALGDNVPGMMGGHRGGGFHGGRGADMQDRKRMDRGRDDRRIYDTKRRREDSAGGGMDRLDRDEYHEPELQERGSRPGMRTKPSRFSDAGPPVGKLWKEPGGNQDFASKKGVLGSAPFPHPNNPQSRPDLQMPQAPRPGPQQSRQNFPPGGSMMGEASEDEFSCFGQSVSHELRNMDREQSVYAKKLISDVLYAGQLGKLGNSDPYYKGGNAGQQLGKMVNPGAGDPYQAGNGGGHHGGGHHGGSPAPPRGGRPGYVREQDNGGNWY